MKIIYLNWSKVTHVTHGNAVKGRVNVYVHVGNVVVHSESIKESDVSDFAKEVDNRVKLMTKEMAGGNLPE